MPLFMNQNEHPTVYKNTVQLQEQNQTICKNDPLAEFFKVQQNEIQQQYEKYREWQNKCWNEINGQLDSLQSNSIKHTEVEAQILETLNVLDQKGKQLHEVLQKDGLQYQEVSEQIRQQYEKMNEIISRLEQFEETDRFLFKQLESQTQVSDQFQTDVLIRLEKQEALSEKILRQVNHIRSILFERTNYLAGKIEEGYKLTSSYVYKLMTGSDQPLTFVMLNQKKYERDQKSKQ
ncbi:hypothetical protein ACQYAD_12360 [Neobacillus sp. SM06]|uniref:hypothetical protein n=1 Tax=Neobacillus sp. SM06 TaxID=3422492 RepID=UPI003D2AD49E